MDDRAFWRPAASAPPRAPHTPSVVVGRALAAGAAREHRDSFLHALEMHRTALVVAPTGSGKTTLLPQFLVDAGWAARGAAVAIVLPTRVAVLAAAARVAYDRGVSPDAIGGSVVGYMLPFRSRRGKDTALVYCTASALVSSVRADPTLSSFSVVMLDDAHERSAAVDVLLSILRVIQERRGDLRVVIASASLAAASDFVRFFGGPAAVATLFIPTRAHAVTVFHTRAPVSDYLKAACDAVAFFHARWIATGRPPGEDILVFVPGAEEVALLCDSVSEWAAVEATSSVSTDLCGSKRRHPSSAGTVHAAANSASPDVFALPLHAGLSPALQMCALEPPTEGTLRVIVSTAIAQSSLTLPSIGIVVDCGFETTSLFSPASQSMTVASVPISKASALQRAGRAGRVRPGLCLRLYTRQHYETLMPTSSAPEILRADLSGPLLSLLSVGVPDLAGFAFVLPPPRDALAASLARLHALGAVRLSGLFEPSESGRNMCDIPLPPHLARALLEGGRRGVGSLVSVACAMLQVVKSLFTTHTGMPDVFTAAEGDVVSIVNVYRRWVSGGMSPRWCSKHGVSQAALRRAREIATQLKRRLHKLVVLDHTVVAEDTGETLASRLCRSLAAGLFSNAYVVAGDGYTYRRVLMPTATAVIHPESVLHGRCPRYVIAVEIVKRQRVFLRHISVIEPAWLSSHAAALFRSVK